MNLLNICDNVKMYQKKKGKFTFLPDVAISSIRLYFPVRQSSILEVPSSIEKLSAKDLPS